MIRERLQEQLFPQQSDVFYPKHLEGVGPSDEQLVLSNFSVELLEFEKPGEPRDENLHGDAIAAYTALVADTSNINSFPWPLWGISELAELKTAQRLYEHNGKQPSIECEYHVMRKLRDLARSPKYNIYALYADVQQLLEDEQTLSAPDHRVVGNGSIIDVPAGEHETWAEKIVVDRCVQGRHLGRAMLADIVQKVFSNKAKLDGRPRKNIHLASIATYNDSLAIHSTLQDRNADIFFDLYWNLHTLSDEELKKRLSNPDILVERAERIFKLLGKSKQYLTPMEVIAIRLGFQHLQTLKDHADVSDLVDRGIPGIDRPGVSLPTRRYFMNYRIWKVLYPHAVRKALEA